MEKDRSSIEGPSPSALKKSSWTQSLSNGAKGVSSGVKEVKRRLKRVMSRPKKIKKDPKPFPALDLLSGRFFHSCLFMLYFWVNYRGRYNKDQLFSFFFDSSLPGVIMPRQRVEWETFQTITLQQFEHLHQLERGQHLPPDWDASSGGSGGREIGVDIYNDTLSVEVSSSWGKWAHQGYRGLIPLLDGEGEGELLSPHERAPLPHGEGLPFSGSGWVELLPRGLISLSSKRVHLSTPSHPFVPEPGVPFPLQGRERRGEAPEIGRDGRDQHPSKGVSTGVVSQPVDALTPHDLGGVEPPLLAGSRGKREALKRDSGRGGEAGGRVGYELERHPLLTSQATRAAFSPRSFPVTSHRRVVSRNGELGWLETLSALSDDLPWKIAGQGEGVCSTLKRSSSSKGGRGQAAGKAHGRRGVKGKVDGGMGGERATAFSRIQKGAPSSSVERVAPSGQVWQGELAELISFKRGYRRGLLAGAYERWLPPGRGKGGAGRRAAKKASLKKGVSPLPGERRSLFEGLLDQLESRMRELFYSFGAPPPLSSDLKGGEGPLGKGGIRGVRIWWRGKKRRGRAFSTPHTSYPAPGGVGRPQQALSKKRAGVPRHLLLLNRSLSASSRLSELLEQLQGKGTSIRHGASDWMSPRAMSGYTYPDLTPIQVRGIYRRLLLRRRLALSPPFQKRVVAEASHLDMYVSLPQPIGTLFHTQLPISPYSLHLPPAQGGKGRQGMVESDAKPGKEPGEVGGKKQRVKGWKGRSSKAYRFPPGWWVERLPVRAFSQRASLTPLGWRKVDKKLLELMGAKEHIVGEVDRVRSQYVGPGIKLERELDGEEQVRGVSLFPESSKGWQLPVSAKGWAESTIGKSKAIPTSAWTSHFFAKRRYVRVGQSPGIRLKKMRERIHLRHRSNITWQLWERGRRVRALRPRAVRPFSLLKEEGLDPGPWHCYPRWSIRGRRARFSRGRSGRMLAPLQLWGKSRPIATSRQEWELLASVQQQRNLYLQKHLELRCASDPKCNPLERIQRSTWARNERLRLKPVLPLPVLWPSILIDRVVEGPANWPLTQADAEPVLILLSAALSDPHRGGIPQAGHTPPSSQLLPGGLARVASHSPLPTEQRYKSYADSLISFQSSNDKSFTLARLMPSRPSLWNKLLSWADRPAEKVRVFTPRWDEPLTPLIWTTIYKPLYLIWGLIGLIQFYAMYGEEAFASAAPTMGEVGFEKERFAEQCLVRTDQFRVIEGGKRRFAGMAGKEAPLRELIEIIWLLRRGHRYPRGRGIKGLLLVGPPGTGKTFLVQALAAECGVPALVQSAASFQDSKSGESGSDKLKAIFDRARELAPSIIFLDEVDSLGAFREGVMTTTVGEQGDVLEAIDSTPLPFSGLARGASLFGREGARREGGGHEEEQPFALKPLSQELSAPESQFDAVPVARSYQASRQSNRKRLGMLMQFLTELDGLRPLEGVFVIGATNRPEVLDLALTRPGRFGRVLHLSLPDKGKRLELLTMYTQHMGVDSGVVWDYLVNRTEGLAAADIATALNYSAIRAILQQSPHTLETIERGLEIVSRQPSRRLATRRGGGEGTDLSLQRRAYYQAGRGLLQTLLPGHPPVAYLPLSRGGGGARGVGGAPLLFDPSVRACRSQLETLLLGCYGGKAGEMILICNAKEPVRMKGGQWFERMAAWQSDLGSSDLSEAASLAQDMVTRWHLYSSEVSLLRESGMAGNYNRRELSREPFSLSLFPYLAERHEHEIRERAAIQHEGVNLLPPAWWQAQVTKQAMFMDVSLQEWFKIYIPNPQESERNVYWLPPDDFYHNIQHSTNLLKRKVGGQDSLHWNHLPLVRAQWIAHGLMTSCFQKAFAILDKRRELLDTLASHLVAFQFLREHEIALLLSRFGGEQLSLSKKGGDTDPLPRQ